LAVSALYPGYLPVAGAWLQEGNIDAALAGVGAPLAIGDVLARWMMALLGAALAAWGLMASARSVAAIARPSVLIGLQLAAAAFALYAVLGGLIGQPAPFFPADVLNSATVLDVLGIPIEVLRSGTGLLIAVAIIVALDLFEQETDRALAAARRRETLARERERIGRDLHDGIIQSIYAAGLHLDEASAALDPSAEVPRALIRTVLGELERISNDIRATIFDLRSAGLETLDAEEIVRGVADELRANTLVDLQLRVEGEWEPRLTPEQAAQLHQIVHEAFSNVLRHARAHRVEVLLACSQRDLQLQVRDDGAGFDLPAVMDRGRADSAHGLPNMRHRAELLNATLTVKSAAGRGTELSLTMPVATARRPS
jgi:signal transduction histidine kinase